MLPKCVENAYRFEMDRFLSGYASEENWENERQLARNGVADLINCESKNIALLSNTVEGIALLVNDYPWESEKEIVLYLGEHMSNRYPWIAGEKKGKFKLKTIVCKDSISTEDIINSITNKTQAIAISFVQYYDGACVNIEKIGKLCRQKGILFVVDGIQAIGRLNVDVENMYIDYMSCGAHKGLLVRNGIGFVYCRDEVLSKLYPIASSSMSLESNNNILTKNMNWFNNARRLENGNRNHQGVYALIVSTNLINSIGIEEIQSQILELEELLINELGKYSSKLLPSCGLPSGILRVNFPEKMNKYVESLLSENKIYCTIKKNYIRFCISFYNTKEQVLVLAKVIKKIIEIGETY